MYIVHVMDSIQKAYVEELLQMGLESIATRQCSMLATEAAQLAGVQILGKTMQHTATSLMNR